MVLSELCSVFTEIVLKKKNTMYNVYCKHLQKKLSTFTKKSTNILAQNDHVKNQHIFWPEHETKKKFNYSIWY